MDKKTKTTLIIALSLFGAGIIIWLCVSMSIHFDYAKLSADFRNGGSSETSTKTEHIDKNIEATGQDITLDLSSADVTVTPSSDDMIHLSYDNSENCYFELKDDASELTLKQELSGGFFFGFLHLQETHVNVTLSIPTGHEGTLNISGASSEISISDIDISGSFGIYSVSGKISIENCKTKDVQTGNTSGGIELTSVETDNIKAESVSGELRVSEIKKSIPIELASVSGGVYAENVKASNLGIETISGHVSLRSAAGQKVSFSTTSGAVELESADFREITFNTVSGDIRGTVSGSAEDYTVYSDTVSGSNNLSSLRGHGERTIDLSSTSGSFDISFEK